MLPLFDSKPFHNAICCAFQRSGGGCDIVKAHSANRKRWWPLCVLFMEIKYWERNEKEREKKKCWELGGEDGGGEGEGCVLGLMLWSLWKRRQEMQPQSEKTLLCSKMFVLLHYTYFLVCCWVLGAGVVFFFFFFNFFLKFLPHQLTIPFPSPLLFPFP